MSAFNLTATQTQFWVLETVNQLPLKETTNLTISQVGFTFCCYVWKQSNMVHEKFSTAIHRMCRQFGQYVLLLGPATISLCICLWVPSLAFAWHVKSWTLPLYGFWLWLVHKCMCHYTSGGCNIILLLGWCDFVTVKAQCLLTSLDRQHRLNVIAVNMVSYSAACW